MILRESLKHLGEDLRAIDISILLHFTRDFYVKTDEQRALATSEGLLSTLYWKHSTSGFKFISDK